MATSNLRFRIIGDDDASGAFLKVAAAARLTKSTFDDIGTSALGLTKMVGGAGLIPALAGAAAATTELGVAFGAAVGASGIFGVSVVGIVADMAKQRQAIKVTTAALAKLTPGTAEYAAKLQELHAQQKTFNQSFGPAAKGFNDMSDAFAKFKAQTSDVTTSVLGKGMELLASVLPKLVPVSNAAGRAVGGLVDELRQWTKGPEFKAVIKWFKDSGPAAITHFGHAVGHTIEGLGGILANFAGPGDNAAKTLDRLTKRFAAWGKSKGVSESVNKFLKYVSGNGPQITSVMQSLAQALPKLAVALGKLGSLNLNAVAMFLNLIANLPQGAFNAVVVGLFGIVAAAKALTILQGVQALFTGATLAMSALGDACIGTRIQLAALWVQEKVGAAITKGMAAAQWLLNAAMDANPIGLLVIAIAALVAGFIIAYKHSETFRNIVNGALTGVQKVASKVFDWLKNAVSFVIGFIKSHWMLLLGILAGPIALAAVLIIKHFGQIKAFIGNVLSAIKGIVSNLWGGVVSILRNGADNIVAGIRALPGRIRALMGSFGDAGRAIIGAFVNGLKNAGGVIQGIAGNVWNALRGLLNAAIDQINRALEFTINPPGPGSISVNAPDIPHLAAGGIVTRPTVALIGEAGPEAVVPLSGLRGGLGGSGGDLGTITIDVTADGRVIQQKLLRLKRVNGGLELGLS